MNKLLLCPEIILVHILDFQAVNRMEIMMNRRQQELLLLQEKIATKESVSFSNLFFIYTFASLWFFLLILLAP